MAKKTKTEEISENHKPLRKGLLFSDRDETEPTYDSTGEAIGEIGTKKAIDAAIEIGNYMEETGSHGDIFCDAEGVCKEYQSRGVYRGSNTHDNIELAESIAELIQIIRGWNRLPLEFQQTCRDNAKDIEYDLRNKVLDLGFAGLPKSRDLQDWLEWLIDHNTADEEPVVVPLKDGDNKPVTPSEPTDLITFGKAMADYNVGRKALQSAVKNDDLKSYRKPGRRPHKISRAAIEALGFESRS